MNLLTCCLLILCSQAASARILPRKCNTLRHVHLAVGNDPSSEMTVSFASNRCNREAPIGGVLVGLEPTLMTDLFLEDEPARSYNFTITGESGKWFCSPYYHHVRVTGLDPYTTYYYKPIIKETKEQFNGYKLKGSSSRLQDKLEEVGLSARRPEDDESYIPAGNRLLLDPYNGNHNPCPSEDKIRSFRTAPPAGTGAVSFAIIGDIGQFPHSEETLARMIRSRESIDAVILAGDIAYTETDHLRWDAFFDFLDDYPLVEYVPMMICPGNHDIDKGKYDGEIFVAYEHRFRMPRVRPPKLGLYDGPLGYMNMDTPPYPLPYEWGNAYYSFIYGPAKFIVLSAYSAMEPESEQYKWLVQELESTDRKVTPWLLIVIHTPMYNTFSVHRHDLQIVAAREHLEPLLIVYKANLVFSGHIHAYQRTKNVANDTVVQTGPMHITVGAGGRKCEAPFKNEEAEPWVAVRDATFYGYGMFRIKNSTTASWDWIHTGHTEGRNYNELYKSNKTLPEGPSMDQLWIRNQLFV